MSVPKLRFKDDDGCDFPDWETKIFGNIATFLKGKGVSKADISKDGNTLCIRYGELYTEYGETIQYVKSKTNISRDKLQLSESNDVIIPASGETQIDIAKASCILISGVALGGDLNIIRTKEDGVFLAYYLNSQKKLDIAKLAQGNSVVHLYASQLKLLKLIIPIKSEQSKIADFLITIDEKIAQLTQKCELLARYKKGVMQQLFSQELRFKDDDGRDFPDWEDKKIKDFLISHKGGAPLTPSDFVKKSDYEVIPKKAISSGGKLGLDVNEGTFCSEKFFKNNLKSVVDNSYLITTLRDLVPSGPSIGYIVKFTSDNSYILAQGVYGIKIDKKLHESFLIHYSNTDKYREMMQTMMVGSTQVHIRNNDFFETPIKRPSLQEQIKIANFLTTIDEKITQTQTYLETVKQYKQGLLQQMFL
jgi:type I restriction enzyme S subunit